MTCYFGGEIARRSIHRAKITPDDAPMAPIDCRGQIGSIGDMGVARRALRASSRARDGSPRPKTRVDTRELVGELDPKGPEARTGDGALIWAPLPVSDERL